MNNLVYNKSVKKEVKTVLKKFKKSINVRHIEVIEKMNWNVYNPAEVYEWRVIATVHMKTPVPYSKLKMGKYKKLLIIISTDPLYLRLDRDVHWRPEYI